MSLLGLDVGTTGCKAIVFDLEGKILGQAYREYPLVYPEPGWIELDSNLVWEATKQAVQEAVGQAGSRDPVKALATSVQGEAVTPIDEKGNALANSIVTFDNRTVPQSQWWEEHLGKTKVFQITGMPLHPMYTLNKIMWWRENTPEVYEQAWKFLCYGDLVLYRLGLEPAIDYSMAGRTMAFDLRRQRWSEEILSQAQVSEDKLAQVVPPGTVVGKIGAQAAAELGLPEGTVAASGGHDQPCGALGAGIIEPKVAMDATGTVECIAPTFAQPVLNDDMLKFNYPCYCHVVPDRYITMAFNFTGGSLLRWYRDVLGKEEREEAEVAGLDAYGVMIGKAAGAPSPLLVLPHFTVTGTPWYDPHSKGAILGLTLSTTKGEIIKGLLDGITFEMRLNLDFLDQAGVAIEQLRAIGGGARSRTWLQLKANIFNRPVSALSVSEAACLGAALLAGTAIGEYTSIEEAVSQVIEVTETFEPDPEEVPKYEERYQLYRELYPTLADLIHRM